MKKADIENKKSLAKTLYLSGMEQQEIAQKTGISKVTISRWCNTEGWKESRAARNITRPELVNKLLLTIDNLIEQVKLQLTRTPRPLPTMRINPEVKDIFGFKFDDFTYGIQQMAGVQSADRPASDTGTQEGHQQVSGHVRGGEDGRKACTLNITDNGITLRHKAAVS